MEPKPTIDEMVRQIADMAARTEDNFIDPTILYPTPVYPIDPPQIHNTEITEDVSQ